MPLISTCRLLWVDLSIQMFLLTGPSSQSFSSYPILRAFLPLTRASGKKNPFEKSDIARPKKKTPKTIHQNMILTRVLRSRHRRKKAS